MNAADTGAQNSVATLLRERIRSMRLWITTHGIAGWDPYDVWDSRIGQWMAARRSLSARAAGRIASELQDHAPVALRRILGTRQRTIPKGVALIAQAEFEAQLHKLDGPGLSTETNLGGWLDVLHKQSVHTGHGIGWGYPFDWQSRILIPRGTPNVVVSTAVGNAFRTHSQLTGNHHSDVCATGVAAFIAESLTRYGPTGPWISYTPIDDFFVHNASLMGAAYLGREATISSDKRMLELAHSVALTSIAQIRGDGTLGYWADEQSQGSLQQDTYHSGFEIRALLQLAVSTGDPRIRAAAINYAETWLTDFSRANGEVCHTRGTKGVVEVHSVAEALLTTAALREAGIISRAEYAARIGAVLRVSGLPLWRDRGLDGGYYAWKSVKTWGRWRTTDIPLIRWGVGWMFLAHIRALTQLMSSKAERP